MGKISSYDAVIASTGIEILPIVQGGATKKVTLNVLLEGLFEKATGNIKLSSVVYPSAPVITINATAGNLNGSYYYAVTFVTATGETETGSSTDVIAPSSQQVDLTEIPVSADTRVTKRRIYRTAAADADPVLKKLVYEIPDNTTTVYTDNVADISLGVAIPMINTTGGGYYDGTTRVMTSRGSSFAVGYDALVNNTGYANTAVGFGSLKVNTTGLRNSAVGVFALFKNTTGSYNTALGVHALNDNLTGSYNTAMGYVALQSNLGSNNTAIGYSSLLDCSTGTNNSALGYLALSRITNGSNNAAIGSNAGRDLAADCHNNTVIGAGALIVSTSGNFNTAIGSSALSSQTGASSNVAVGFQSLFSNLTSSDCVALGTNSGYYETAANKLFIDNRTRASEADGRIKALVYGIFAAAPADQLFTLNAVLRLTPLASAPTSNLAEGNFYCGTDHHVYYYNGTDWKQLDN